MAVPAALDASAVGALAAAIAGTTVAATAGASTATTAGTSASDVLVLRGATPGTFCRGLAPRELSVPPSPALRDGLRRYADILEALATGATASIAVVEGAVFGGGIALAAACDVVLATPESQFGLPETSAGLPPYLVWAVLARRMPVAAMQRLALEGRAISATEAVALGLVDRLASPDQMPREVAATVRQLARVPAAVTALVKSHAPHADPVRAALAAAVDQTWRRLHDAQVVEALTARMEVA